MSLVSICTSVLAETGWPDITTIQANQDPSAKQVFAIANRELQQLTHERLWPHTEVEYTFNTVIGQRRYNMPAAFRVPVHRSVYNTAKYYQLKGSLPQEEWNARRYGLLSNLSLTGFKQGYLPDGTAYIDLDALPTAVEGLVLLYQSNKLARAEDGTEKPLYEKDTDVSKVPEHLIELGVRWRFRRAKGLDFSVELVEYNASVATEFARYKGVEDIPIGGSPLRDDAITGGYVRDTGFGS